MIEEIKTPDSLSAFMNAVMEEARRDSLVDLLEDWGVSMDEYEEIREWFKMFGVTL